MTTPFKNNYACGLAVETKGTASVIHHGGGIRFNTELAYYREETNVRCGERPAPEDIATKLAALMHGERVTLPSEHQEITLDSPAARDLRRHLPTGSQRKHFD